MNLSSNTISKKYHIQRKSNPIDSIGYEVDFCDTETNALIKVAMFSNVKSETAEISEFFQKLLKKYSIISDRKPFKALFSIFSYAKFKEKFLLAAAEEIKIARVSWLLEKCDPYELAIIDAKNSLQYFSNLEKHLFDKYVAEWDSPQKLFFFEFKNLRKKIIFQFFRKNMHFILFWCLIFLAVFLGLHITSKENSLTMWQQLKGWIFFLLQRLN
ncbi:hypothetical protein QEJ31_15280 [Pigmentibacter sp. JX0631]|uniref:hypothetical protein n=1 Tax=Pigmentibacter sp. JX0631 TaxID=2976982 RepID=UPI002469288F|nr:hypothetical protein [Pigmentibacter sp. JX0631]WGL59893.1 hypothetical protein QEJ31_15280 [Pigmentibacter sp. JX0631]